MLHRRQNDANIVDPRNNTKRSLPTSLLPVFKAAFIPLRTTLRTRVKCHASRNKLSEIDPGGLVLFVIISVR